MRTVAHDRKESRRDPDRRFPRSDRVDVCVWLAVWAPYALIAASRVGFDWFPVQDQAVLDMRVRDVLSGSDVPLVGAFSRFGWSHPGPVWFYVLAPFRWIAGGPTGILLGSVLLFGAGFATLVLLVRRRYGNYVAAAAVLGSLPAVMAAGSFSILIPWNPHLAFAWYPVFLFLCLSAADRRSSDLAPGLFLGAVLTQLHVGYVVLVGITYVAAALTVVARERAALGHLVQRAVQRRSVWAWAGLTAVIWVPPLAEQAIHGSDGNLSKLMEFFGGDSPTGPVTGWGFAARVLGGVVRVPLTGLGGHGEATAPFTGFLIPGSRWLIALPVALVSAAGLAGLARHNTRAVRMAGLCAAALGSGLLALSRVVGERWPYLFVWRFALVWFVVTASSALLVWLLVVRGPRREPFAMATSFGRVRGAAVLAIGILILDVSVVGATFGDRRSVILPLELQAQQLTEQVMDRPRPSSPVLIVRFDDVLQGVADGVMNGLDRAGWPVGVEPELGFKYGDHRTVATDRAGQVWFISETSVGTTLADSVPGRTVIAKVTPLSDSEETEIVDLQLKLIRALKAQGRLDLLPSVGSSLVGISMIRGGIDTAGINLGSLERLNRKVERSGDCRCSVVSVPRGTPFTSSSVAGLVAAGF